MARDDMFTLTGVVVDVYAGAKFRVKLENDAYVLAQASGKMRKNMIKIIKGDTVRVEFSVYDLNNGRIVWREHSEYSVV